MPRQRVESAAQTLLGWQRDQSEEKDVADLLHRKKRWSTMPFVDDDCCSVDDRMLNDLSDRLMSEMGQLHTSVGVAAATPLPYGIQDLGSLEDWRPQIDVCMGSRRVVQLTFCMLALYPTYVTLR